jgi:hypothetical protein
MEVIRLSATTGTTGSASAVSSDVIEGEIQAVYVEVQSGGTCNCTLAMQSDGENILALGTVTSSAWYYPRKAICDSAGSVLTYNGIQQVYEPYIVFDHIVWSITAATTAKTFGAVVFVK